MHGGNLPALLVAGGGQEVYLSLKHLLQNIYFYFRFLCGSLFAYRGDMTLKKKWAGVFLYMKVVYLCEYGH